MPRYRYTIEFYPPERSGWTISLEKPDFQPAVEWCQFEALRAGHLPTTGKSVVEPVFAEGGPTVTGFRITVPADGDTFNFTIPYSYFSSLASRYRSAFVKSGKLADGEACYWTMSAWQCDDGIDTNSHVTELLVNVESASIQSLLSNPSRAVLMTDHTSRFSSREMSSMRPRAWLLRRRQWSVAACCLGARAVIRPPENSSSSSPPSCLR